MNSPTMAVKEIKNGRLAMTAFVGFATQVRAHRCPPAVPPGQLPLEVLLGCARSR